ncbi:hypothetical protein HPP92_011393 [Vanilla planifolia]|uniref:SHSP domain-containing protein n=1 Tax=Vanilla planifolia TaxID=51239 RepID=A0A835R6J9_VANPL|nr:hypothetical protein HPP92_011701 [Vanilla planifolia]KAG0483309.1 hypothetical protein HPP92_011393 [Vanilla planifolia]
MFSRRVSKCLFALHIPIQLSPGNSTEHSEGVNLERCLPHPPSHNLYSSNVRRPRPLILRTIRAARVGQPHSTFSGLGSRPRSRLRPPQLNRRRVEPWGCGTSFRLRTVRQMMWRNAHQRTISEREAAWRLRVGLMATAGEGGRLGDKGIDGEYKMRFDMPDDEERCQSLQEEGVLVVRREAATAGGGRGSGLQRFGRYSSRISLPERQ